MNGLIGKKVGMTQFFDDQGRMIPVTVIEAGPCVVVQRKTKARDGYEAAQVGFGAQKAQRLSLAAKGHQKKAGVIKALDKGEQAFRTLREFALDAGEDPKPGEAFTVKLFEGVSHVDITGITKGQGYQGVVKRHRMGGGPQSHGHMSHRRIGAIGQRTWPARIMKNKRMPGHMGHVTATTQNLRVVQVREEDNALLVEGSVPGANGSTVIVRKALKKNKAAKAS
jgi:large subunit ribosomal protein L3